MGNSYFQSDMYYEITLTSRSGTNENVISNDEFITLANHLEFTSRSGDLLKITIEQELRETANKIDAFDVQHKRDLAMYKRLKKKFENP